MPRMFGIDVESLIRVLSVAAIPGLLAITLHEVSHGWVAKQLGDPTASMLGRLTINPLKHVDPIGTILVPIGLLVFVPGGPVFGWAKPVPVDTRNLRRRKRDMAIVAAAGPDLQRADGAFLGGTRQADVSDGRGVQRSQRVGSRDVRVRYVYQCRIDDF